MPTSLPKIRSSVTVNLSSVGASAAALQFSLFSHTFITRNVEGMEKPCPVFQVRLCRYASHTEILMDAGENQTTISAAHVAGINIRSEEYGLETVPWSSSVNSGIEYAVFVAVSTSHSSSVDN